ncbi:hypothetical protein MPSEU_000337100 [Mayamaea pseudoterrestris]|nr:hypothetical protein MPSEU_000337100 [Mayamaea pseudoterrestris]
MSSLEWLVGESLAEFIRKSTARDRHYKLVIDGPFVANYLNLHETDLNDFKIALQNVHANTLRLDSLPDLPIDADHLRRFQFLCQTLASGLQATDYLSISKLLNLSHVAILKNMHWIRHLSLIINKSDERSMRALAAAVRELPALTTAFVQVPRSFYSIILPAMCSVLRDIHLHAFARLDNELIMAESSLIIAGLLGRNSSLLTIRLQGCHFTSEQSQDVFCRAIEVTRIQSLSLVGCKFADAETLSSAIGRSKLKEMKLSYLKFVTGRCADFLGNLSWDINGMTQLEDLCCDFFNTHSLTENNTEVEATQLANDRAVVQVAHICSSESTACADSFKLPSARDIAIPSSDRISGACSSPQKNYTIQRIRLNAVARISRTRQPKREPWSWQYEKSVTTIPKLNAAGRSYMLVDSMNRRAGMRMLGAVSSDLDCAFYHLSQENPSLCGIVEAKDEAAARKKRQVLRN